MVIFTGIPVNFLFELNLIAVKLVQNDTLVVLLQQYHAAAVVTLYYKFYYNRNDSYFVNHISDIHTRLHGTSNCLPFQKPVVPVS
jgi:hypothetical protein